MCYTAYGLMAHYLATLFDKKYNKSWNEVHVRTRGAQQTVQELQMYLKRMVHYWPTHNDYRLYIFGSEILRVSISYQVIHQPSEPLITTTHSWPLATWGMDNTGPYEAAMVNRYKYILVASDHFSKLVEAILVGNFTSQIVSDFIRTHIIHRSCIP